MRGQDAQQPQMFSYISAEDRVPADHPLRAIRKMVDEALHRLSPLFSELYAPAGPEFHPNGCCGRCCFRCSIRFVASAN